MASYEIRVGKKGTTYRLIACLGYLPNGKKEVRKKTVEIPSELKSKQRIEKWLTVEAAKFEDELKNGKYFDGNKMTFGEYASHWFTSIAEKTYSPTLLPTIKTRLEQRIIPALGHLKLTKLQTHHLDGFFDYLQETCPRLDLYYTPNEALREKLSKLPITKTCEELGISYKTYARLKTPEGKTNLETANKLCEYFKLTLDKSFTTTSRAERLSGRTVKHHYDIVRAVLSDAKRNKLIAENPINDILKLKKYRKKEIPYYDDEQIKELLFRLVWNP